MLSLSCFEHIVGKNTLKLLHMARFRGRDIISFRPADVNLCAKYFCYCTETDISPFLFILMIVIRFYITNDLVQ